jgi:hypothetical protein
MFWIFIEVSMTKITQNFITTAPWSEITLSNLELIIIEGLLIIM